MTNKTIKEIKLHEKYFVETTVLINKYLIYIFLRSEESVYNVYWWRIY